MTYGCTSLAPMTHDEILRMDFSSWEFYDVLVFWRKSSGTWLWQKFNRSNLDGFIELLGEKSMTCTIHMIAKNKNLGISDVDTATILLWETKDGQTNIDGDVIDYLAKGLFVPYREKGVQNA